MQPGPIGCDVSLNDIVDQAHNGSIFFLVLGPSYKIFPLLFEIPGSDIHVDVGFVFIVIIQSSLGNPGLYCDFGKRDIGQVFLLQQRFRCVQDLLFDIIISRCCHYHFSS